MSDSKIEWTDKVWNPVTGCTRVSEGCRNCYAERQAARNLPNMQGLAVMTDAGPRWTGKVVCHEDRLQIPVKWKKPRRVFVNSMSDLFHESVPFEFIDKVFATMALCRHHTFQILTKRPERMLEYLSTDTVTICKRIDEIVDQYIQKFEYNFGYICRFQPIKRNHFWPISNVWLGVSVEDQPTADVRIPLLLQSPSAVRFLSCEPLLGQVDLTAIKRTKSEGFLRPLDGRFNRIDQVIVGGESGPGARPMHPDWARSIRDQCQAAGVPFFFKQWGGVKKKAAGRLLDGREWNEMPEAAK